VKEVQRALVELGAAAERVRQMGFVVTGKVSIVRPSYPGLTHPRDEGDVDPRGTFGEIRLKNRRPPGVPAPRRDHNPAPAVAAPVTGAVAAMPEPAARSEVESLSGECCMKCGGHRLQQAGACKVCLDCGESGGCG